MTMTKEAIKKATKELATKIAEGQRKIQELPNVYVAVGKKTCKCTSPFCEHAEIESYLKEECPYPN